MSEEETSYTWSRQTCHEDKLVCVARLELNLELPPCLRRKPNLCKHGWPIIAMFNPWLRVAAFSSSAVHARQLCDMQLFSRLCTVGLVGDWCGNKGSGACFGSHASAQAMCLPETRRQRRSGHAVIYSTKTVSLAFLRVIIIRFK